MRSRIDAEGRQHRSSADCVPPAFVDCFGGVLAQPSIAWNHLTDIGSGRGVDGRRPRSRFIASAG
jgi:hypothetical protein